MELFRKRINRKTFFISIIFLLIVATVVIPVSQKNAVLCIFFSAIIIVLYFLCIIFRYNDINGEMKFSNTLLLIVISCIPGLSIIALGFLIFSKGNPSNIKSTVTRTENRTLFHAVVGELQNKYAAILNTYDENTQAQFYKDLYYAYDKIPGLKKILIGYHADLTDIVWMYKLMQDGDILWDEQTGEYIPFIAMFNSETLLFMLNNKSLPEAKLRQKVFDMLNLYPKTSRLDNAFFKDKLAYVFNNTKMFWLLVFFIISFGMLIYPPYHTVIPNKGTTAAGYNWMGYVPSGVSSAQAKFTSVDYATLAFHEVILATICGAGCTITMLMKRK